MTNTPAGIPDSSPASTDTDPAAGDYTGLAEPRSENRLVLESGVWHQISPKYVRVQFISTGSFLLIAMLTIGVAVPTPGAVGSFHEAFRLGTTVFFGAPNDAAVGSAIVLHAFSVGPALLLGLFFAAQEGLNLAGMRQLANQAEPGPTA